MLHKGLMRPVYFVKHTPLDEEYNRRVAFFQRVNRTGQDSLAQGAFADIQRLEPAFLDRFISEGIDAPDFYTDLSDKIEAIEAGNFNIGKQTPPNEYIPTIYGQVRTGGDLIFLSSSGIDREYLHMVFSLCEGEIESIDEVWIDDIKATDAIYSGLVTIPNDSAVSRTRYGWVGTETQEPDPTLVSDTEWTIAHQLKGVAYVYIKLKHDKDVFSGIPKFLFDVRGMRVYDPRDSSTGYSTNPALCIRDYLTADIYGKTIGSGAINDTAIGTAADYCETRMDGRSELPTNGTVKINGAVSVGAYTAEIDGVTTGSIKAGDTFVLSGDSTQYLIITPIASPITSSGTINFLPAARAIMANNADMDFRINYFETNGIIDNKRDVLKNIKLLMTSCRGMLPKIGGQYTLIIEKDETSSFDFNEDNIIGGWSFRKGGKRSRKNLVKAKFANPSSNWRSDLVTQDSDAYRTKDGGERLEVTIPLTLETNPYRALYLANTVLKKSRQDIFVSFTASLAAYNVTAGKIVTITHDTAGWDAKTFRVIAATLMTTGLIACSLQEHEPLVYDRSAEAGVEFPLDTNLPDPNHVRIASGLTPIQTSNWTRQWGETGITTTIWDLAAHDSLVIAVGIYGEITASSDGMTWSAKTSPVTTDHFYGIEGGGTGAASYFCIVGGLSSSSRIVTSPDGTTWLDQYVPTAKKLWDVATDGSEWVAVGERDSGTGKATVLSCSDITVLSTVGSPQWTDVSHTIGNHFYGVGYTSLAGWVAVGIGGIIATGTSSGSLTTRASTVTDTLHDVASSDDIIVVVGDTVILTSTDGISWTSVSHPKSALLFAVVYAQGLFVAVGGTDGTDTYIVTSVDGINWTEKRAPDKFGYHGLAYLESVGVYVAGAVNITKPDTTTSSHAFITSLYQ